MMDNQPPDPPQADKVNHPSHYTWHPAGVEAVTVCEAFSYNLGNAMAYIWRSGGSVTKGEVETDLRKAVWYIERELARIAQCKQN
jgi:hypothetical protein